MLEATHSKSCYLILAVSVSLLKLAGNVKNSAGSLLEKLEMAENSSICDELVGSHIFTKQS